MSQARHRVPLDTEWDTDSSVRAVAPFVIPANSERLFEWLDEAPNFISYETEVTVWRDKSERSPDYPTTEVRASRFRREEITTRTRTEQMYVSAEYEETARASHDSQADVAEAWGDMQFPSHNIVADPETGRTAARLYSLSSYQTGVDGPSVGRTMMVRRQRRPGSEFVCDECDYSTSVFDPNSFRVRVNKREKQVQDHINEVHDGDATYYRRDGSANTESEMNYHAYQYPSGAGRIQHYERTAAIRSEYGVVLANEQDFAKGRARVTYPDEYDARIPLTGMMEYLEDRDESVFDVTAVETAEVDTTSSYYDGRTFTRTWYLLHFDSGAGFLVAYDETAKDYHERKCGFWYPPDEETPDIESVDTALRPPEVADYLAATDDASVVPSNDYTNATGRGQGGHYYTEEQHGRDVIRQGEWFFIPLADSLAEAAQTCGVHEPDGDFAVFYNESSLPRVCSSCGTKTFEYRADGAVECDDCGSLYFTKKETSSTRPLGSHTPRDAVEIDGNVFVRGMVTHASRDHNAINLRETWHLAVDNGRDGLVFDTSDPDNASGRAGSTMRVE